jgi:hypothetical protein
MELHCPEILITVAGVVEYWNNGILEYREIGILG